MATAKKKDMAAGMSAAPRRVVPLAKEDQDDDLAKKYNYSELIDQLDVLKRLLANEPTFHTVDEADDETSAKQMSALLEKISKDAGAIYETSVKRS